METGICKQENKELIRLLPKGDKIRRLSMYLKSPDQVKHTTGQKMTLLKPDKQPLFQKQESLLLNRQKRIARPMDWLFCFE
jgi:hypothetical protein